MKNVRTNLIVAVMGVTAVIATGCAAAAGGAPEPTAAAATASPGVSAPSSSVGSSASSSAPSSKAPSSSSHAPETLYSTSRSELIVISDRAVDLMAMGLVLQNTTHDIPDSLIVAEKDLTTQIGDKKGTVAPADTDVLDACTEVMDVAIDALEDGRVTDAELTKFATEVAVYGTVSGYEFDTDRLTAEAKTFLVQG